MEKDDAKVVETPKKSSGGRSCCYFSCCLLFLIISILILTLFLFFPKVPNFEVQNISVKSLDFSPISGIIATVKVKVKAKNQNKNIGFVYRNGGYIIFQYAGVNLCDAELPSFEQGPASESEIDVKMKGVTPFRLDLVKALVKQRSYRRIPLELKLKMPVGVVVGKLRLTEFKAFVNFSLVVDNFSSNLASRIVSTDMTYRIDFF